MQRTFIINFKNYKEILGERSIKLAEAAEKVARRLRPNLIIAPPAPMLHSIAQSVTIPVFSQKLDNRDEGKSTGAVIAESVKAAGCEGSLINHSESRIGFSDIKAILIKMRSLGLAACVSAESAEEIAQIARLSPEYLAIEPPELIGTGMAVSKARPELLLDSVDSARRVGYRGRILCGAGIVSGDDVSAAIRLGAEGVLASSGVVKAKDWSEKITELANALNS